MPVVTDMLGRRVEVPNAPQRIISLVPSQTELLYDLGLEDEVVGITKFCVHPERWFRNKARVGGTKTVSIDKVAALYPDLIIANKEENVKEQIEALEKIAPVWVSDIDDLDDALRMITEVGKLTFKVQESIDIANRIAEEFRSLLDTKANTQRRQRTAYLIWRDPWMCAGIRTFIHDMLDRTGFINVMEDVYRYPEITLEALAVRGVELILLSSEPYPFKEAHIAEINAVLPGVAIRLVDGEMFSWYGSRLLTAPEYFATLLQTL